MRALMATVLALAAILALQAARAAAVPGVQVWTGQASGPTPDISDTGYTFPRLLGQRHPVTGIAGTLNFTVDGVPRISDSPMLYARWRGVPAPICIYCRRRCAMRRSR